MTQTEEIIILRDLIARLVRWNESDELKGAYMMAWLHGYQVSQEFGDQSGTLWEEARAVVGVAPKS